MVAATARRGGALDPSRVFAGAAQSEAVSSAWIGAAKSGNVGMLESLVERHSTGLLDYRCGAVGNGALHWAAAKNHVGAVRWLLERGAKLELRNNSGATALHSGAANGASGCVHELLGRGADAHHADSSGRTAHDWAQVRAHKDVLAALRRHTGLPFEQPGATPSGSPRPTTAPQPMLSPSRGRVHPSTSTPHTTPRRQRSLRLPRAASEEDSFVGLDGSPWQPLTSPSSPASSASSGGGGDKRRRELASRSEGRRLVRAEAQLEDHPESSLSSENHRVATLEMALRSAAAATRKGMEETERLRAKVASLEAQLSKAATSARDEGYAARAALSECENRLSAEASVHAAFRAQVEAEMQAAAAARDEEETVNAREMQALQKAVEKAQEEAAVAAAEQRALESAECAKSEARESERRALATAAAAAAAEMDSAKKRRKESVAAWEARGVELADRLMAAESEAAALRQRLTEADERVIATEAERQKAEDVALAAEETAAAVEAASNVDQQGFEEAAGRAADRARKEADAAAAIAAAGVAEATAAQIADLSSERDAARAQIVALEEALERDSAANAAQATEGAVLVERLTTQHEEDVSLCQRLQEQLEAAVASATAAQDALSHTRGLAASATAAHDDLRSELDVVRSKVKTLEASSQEVVEARRESELKLKQLAEEVERERAEANKLRADATENTKARNAAEQAAVAARDETARAQQLAQTALAQTKVAQSQAQKARLKAESQHQTMFDSPSAADVSSTMDVSGTPQAQVTGLDGSGDLNALKAEIRRLRNQITTMEAAHEISAAQEEEREETRERERVEERQAELIRAEERERERAGYEALLRELQSERATAAETARQAQKVQAATEEMVAKHAKLQQESQDERERLLAELAELQSAVEATNKQQHEDEVLQSMKLQSESTTQTDPVPSPQLSDAQTETTTEARAPIAPHAEVEQKIAQHVQAATEEMVAKHAKLQQESQDERERLLAELAELQSAVEATNKQQHEDAEASLAAARSGEAEAREQMELLRAQMLEAREQQQRSSFGAQHTQTDEDECIGVGKEDELRSALERVAELERNAARAEQSTPSFAPEIAVGAGAAVAPVVRGSPSGSDGGVTVGTLLSQRGEIVDGVCATCGSDVPVRSAALAHKVVHPSKHRVTMPSRSSIAAQDHPLLKLRATLRSATVQRASSPSLASDKSTAR